MADDEKSGDIASSDMMPVEQGCQSPPSKRRCRSDEDSPSGSLSSASLASQPVGTSAPDHVDTSPGRKDPHTPIHSSRSGLPSFTPARTSMSSGRRSSLDTSEELANKSDEGTDALVCVAGGDDAAENDVIEAGTTCAANAIQSTAASASASSLLQSTDFATDVPLEKTIASSASSAACQRALIRRLSESDIKSGKLAYLTDLKRILYAHPDPHIQHDFGQNLAFFAAGRSTALSAEGSSRSILELLVAKYGVNATAVDVRGQTSLFFAARQGDTESCAYLISLHCDPDHRDANEQSPLFYSASNGRTDCSDFLINAKAALDVDDSRGQTPLFWASKSSEAGVVELLLHRKANVHHVDVKQQTALFYAETPFIAQTLLTAKCDANHCNARGQTAIHHAATTKSVSHIEMLAAHGADLGIADSMGWTCLFHAAKTNRVEVCKLLLKLGVDLLHTDLLGQTARLVATAHQKHQAASALATAERSQHTAQPSPRSLTRRSCNDKGPGITDARPSPSAAELSSPPYLLHSSRSSGDPSPKLTLRRARPASMSAEPRVHAAQLYKAVREGSLVEVQGSVERGVNPASVVVAMGQNLMFLAAIRQHEAYEVCSLLAEKQVDPTLEDARLRQTPLYFAVRGHEQAGGLECARFLLGRQCDPNHTDLNKQTPLFYAASRSDSGCAELLLAARASVNVTDVHGQTPLFYAVQATTTVSSLRVLLTSRAEVTTHDDSGQSPLFYAQSADAVELLLQHRADACDRDPDGRTPLFAAAAAAADGVMRALVKAGSDIHATDSRGETCLFYAARMPDLRSSMRLCQIIVQEFGADASHRSHRQASALDVSPHHGPDGSAFRQFFAGLPTSAGSGHSSGDEMAARP
eukprot:gnl/TRDRNA2_/TRDRNA2_174158_c0_seq7.p1 gnl/TRDRNA2_/TRDRNA2_174158_c0~~gnl/TRDRNA2_/TRDRNA2_174158_c0_seq7.p1  ORF type:complete len:898 (-),score=117.33 gnl/TRDRNA2_/TRDRNA2_174158_c0_seq7:38-2650(-)